MKVFGIGLSKTGTKSLNAALRLLGFDVRHYPKDPVTASEVLEGRPYSILDQCDGLTDLHAAVRFRELDSLFPGSRFVLTTRDKESWLDSCRRHFEKHPPENQALEVHRMIACLRRQAYGLVEFDAEALSRAYDHHVECVLDHFRDRAELLVIDIIRGDGWDALCRFCGRPDPGAPFPFIR
jgi:hypothetical protein